MVEIDLLFFCTRGLSLLRTFFAEKALTAKALLAAPAIWLVLRSRGFAAAERIVSESNRGSRKQRDGSAAQVVDAVQSAFRYLPGSTCLLHALTLKFFLSRRHIAARIRIGVARDRRGRLDAHAWVEGESWIAPCGNPNLETYAKLEKSDAATIEREMRI